VGSNAPVSNNSTNKTKTDNKDIKKNDKK